MNFTKTPMRSFILLPQRTVVVILIWRTSKFVCFSHSTFGKDLLYENCSQDHDTLAGRWMTIHILTALSNECHFFQVLARDPFLAMLLEMSLILLIKIGHIWINLAVSPLSNLAYWPLWIFRSRWTFHTDCITYLFITLNTPLNTWAY